MVDKRTIPFYKPEIDEQEIEAVSDVLRKGWLTTGRENDQFEKELQSYFKSKHQPVTISSCTEAILIALKALDLRPGSEVITTPLTFVSTINVIKHLGLKPVCVDIENETLNMDATKLSELISPKTASIIPVHFAGHPVEQDQIKEIADIHQIPVIEDAAHAMGSEYKGSKIGSRDDIISTFSFYATKNLTTGEGGMISGGGQDFLEKVRLLRLHGLSKDAWKRYDPKGEGKWKYDVIYSGYKSNLTDMQAAIGRIQLKKLDSHNKKRNDLVEIYQDLLDHPSLINPTAKSYVNSSWHLYPLRVLGGSDYRNGLINYLNSQGIGTSLHFIPVFNFTAYKDELREDKMKCTNTNEVYDQLISLPLFPSMQAEDVEYISQHISLYLNKTG